MCDKPDCPANDDYEPMEVTDENRNYMRVEATSAAQHVLELFARGWGNGAHGIISDISDKWGFEGVTRMVYIVTRAIAILPVPEDSPLKMATPETINRRIREAAGNDIADHVALQMATFSEQVMAAFKEVTELGRKGDEHEEYFIRRFDEITDQEHMTQPLIQSLILHATVVLAAARKARNVFALDQFKQACASGLDLSGAGGRDEVADLNALLNLPDQTED